MSISVQFATLLSRVPPSRPWLPTRSVGAVRCRRVSQVPASWGQPGAHQPQWRRAGDGQCSATADRGQGLMPGRRVTRYAALGAYLEARAAAGEARVALTLDEIEATILEWPLPRSARSPHHHKGWWRGSAEIHAWEGWLRAGWRVETVDLAHEIVTFARGQGTRECPPDVRA